MWWMEALRYKENMLYTGKPLNSTSHRNRYKIATANGQLMLSIPVKGGRKQNMPLSEMLIDDKHAWQRQHWGALFSAYGRAPFFTHYGPELEVLLFADHKNLLDFNLAAIEWLRKSMRLEINITTTEELDPGDEALHWRLVHPDTVNAKLYLQISTMPYHQVFEDRWGFLPNLSAIDLLMNEGPYAGNYLLSNASREG